MLVHANCHRDVKMTNRNGENKLPYHLGDIGTPDLLHKRWMPY